MSKELIETKALIDDAWVNYALQTIEDNGSSYSYYIHTIAETIEIGGGMYGRQNIYPLELSNTDEEFLISSIERLDSLIDLDFERVYDQSLAASRLYLDSKIEVDGNPLGMVLANGDENQRWFEIILDGSRLNDQSYRRYAYLHEYGHTLGLEHPFNDVDGDSAGGTNAWTSSIYPEDTVMAYRAPLSGEWPQWFSASDTRALVESWGLEDDTRGSYQLSKISSGQLLMIGDPDVAKKQIESGDYNLEGFKQSEREVYGSANDDVVHGITPTEGGWTHEWIYVGEGNDVVLGGGGRDQLFGGFGDDILRGGHGQDVIEGGLGDDQLYGGGGRNTLITGGGKDSLFVLSDYVSHGEEAGRNHNGNLADVIIGVDDDDRITILGNATEELNVVKLEGCYGIEAMGSLEAIIIDSEINEEGISAILTGDETRWF